MEVHRQRALLCQLRAKGTDLLCHVPFGAVHVERQADDYGFDLLGLYDLQDRGDKGRAGLDDLQRGAELLAFVAEGKAGPFESIIYCKITQNNLTIEKERL
jgi:hypothetical protein